jgi:hypothetical protein
LFLYLNFAYCIVESVKVSPKMKDAKELPVSHFWSHLFLFNWFIRLSILYYYKLFNIVLFIFENKRVFFSALAIVFFTNSLPTYLNHNTIFHNVGYKKLLRGTCWVLVSLLLDWSFWSLDLFKILWFVRPQAP